MWPGAELVQSIFMAEKDLMTVTHPKEEEKATLVARPRSSGSICSFQLVGT
jgi:hypothetical protein